MKKIDGGLFITFEGIEGCGKTTQSALLAEALEAEGYALTRTREPGGTDIGGRIRAVLLDPGSKGLVPLAELLLYFADRAQHISEVIEPALAGGRIVLCDRYGDATEAYQGHGRGLDVEEIRTLAGICTRGLSPDLTLLLDLPAETGLARAIGRNDENGQQSEARFEQEAMEFHERVRRGYLDIAGCEPGRVKVIDASGTVGEVSALIRAAVDAALKDAEDR